MLKPVETAPGLSRTADEGDVPNSVLGVGYDEDVLERELELEELAEAELGDGITHAAAEEPELPALPGERPGRVPAQVATGEPSATIRPAAPSWPAKVLRTFVFTSLAAFLTAVLPIADQLANGQEIDISLTGSLLLAAIAGAIAAGLRAAAALAPVFPDDDVGLRRRPGGTPPPPSSVAGDHPGG